MKEGKMKLKEEKSGQRRETFCICQNGFMKERCEEKQHRPEGRRGDGGISFIKGMKKKALQSNAIQSPFSYSPENKGSILYIYVFIVLLHHNERLSSGRCAVLVAFLLPWRCKSQKNNQKPLVGIH